MIPAQIPVTSCLQWVGLGISQLESSSQDYTGSYELDPKVELGTDRASLFGAHEGSGASVSGEKALFWVLAVYVDSYYLDWTIDFIKFFLKPL